MSESAAILLADDNADDVELIRRAFLKAGFAAGFHAVCGGNEVIKYLRGDEQYRDRTRFPFPRLVLLDFKMRVDGWEILQWIRQRPEFRRLPVIVFTGSNYPGDIDKAYDLGANSYLVKPQTPEGLVEAIKQIGEFWLRLTLLPGRDTLPTRLEE
jgi:CheY-like chemotaxis protein